MYWVDIACQTPNFWTVQVVMSMRRSPHIFCRFSFTNASFLECTGYVTLAITSIPINSHLYRNHLKNFNFSVACWCFRTTRTVLKYAMSCFDVSIYIKISSTIIFDSTFSSRAPQLMSPIPFVAMLSLLQILDLYLGPPQTSLLLSISVRGEFFQFFLCLLFCHYFPIPTLHAHCNKKNASVSITYTESLQQAIIKANGEVILFILWQETHGLHW